LRKDSLYAQANIPDPRSQKAFSGLYKFLLNHVPAENLTIHLSAPTELLLERIRRRKRYYELTVAENYFVKINAAYEDFYAKFPGRLLRIPMDQWDFVGDPGLYAKLSMLIDEQTGAQGKHVHRWPK
jgi:deoxyadenosine/deoxycytidine kinase